MKNMKPTAKPAKNTPLRTALAASTAHLATYRVPAHGDVQARLLFVHTEPRQHPWLYVVWLRDGYCNWEPMCDWADLLDELANRGATPDSAWEPAFTTRVTLENGGEVVLLERDMTPEEVAWAEANV
jgi:hypothetical protein